MTSLLSLVLLPLALAQDPAPVAEPAPSADPAPSLELAPVAPVAPVAAPAVAVELPAPPPLTLEEQWAQDGPDAVLLDAVDRRTLGDFEGADARLAWLRVHHDGPAARYHAALSLEFQERFGDAVALYASVARDFPGQPQAADARFRQALCLEDLGRHRDALALVKALKRTGDWSDRDRLTLELEQGVTLLRDGRDRRGVRRIQRTLAGLQAGKADLRRTSPARAPPRPSQSLPGRSSDKGPYVAYPLQLRGERVPRLRGTATLFRRQALQLSCRPLLPPLADVGGVKPLTAQHRPQFAGLAAPVQLAQNLELVLGGERPPLGAVRDLGVRHSLQLGLLLLGHDGQPRRPRHYLRRGCLSH